MHNGAKNIARGSCSIIARFAWKHQTILERINITTTTPAYEINTCLKYSTLWRRHVKTLKLTSNMHVQLQNDRTAEIFSHQLLETGNGKVPVDLTAG
jgi:hypothetical protein